MLGAEKAHNADYSLGGEQWKAEALASNIFNYGRLTNCDSGGSWLARRSRAVAHPGGAQSRPASARSPPQMLGRRRTEAVSAFYSPGALWLPLTEQGRPR